MIWLFDLYTYAYGFLLDKIPGYWYFLIMTRVPTNLKTDRPLPDKAKIFALLYEGNGVQALRAAGLEGSTNNLGSKAGHWLKDKRVQKIIQSRLKQKHAEAIGSRQDRQSMWAMAAQCLDPQSLQIVERLEASLWQLALPLTKSNLSADEWGNLNLKTGDLLVKLQKNALKASEMLGRSQADFVDVTLTTDSIFTYAKGLEQLKKHLQGSPALEDKMNSNLLDFAPREDEELNKIIDINDFKQISR